MKKRILTLTLAVLMILGTTTMALAETSAVTGKSSFVGVDEKEVKQLSLPTTNSLDFYVDPQGLLGNAATEGGWFDYGAAGDGLIVQKGTGAYFINECGYDLEVGIAIDEAPTTDTITVIPNTTAFGASAPADKEAKVQLFAGENYVSSDEGGFAAVSGKALDLDNYVNSTGGGELTYVLAAADWKVIRTGDTSFTPIFVEGSGNGNAIMFTGQLNDGATYSSTDKFTLKCTFTADKGAIDGTAAAAAALIYASDGLEALEDATALTITTAIPTVAPTNILTGDTSGFYVADSSHGTLYKDIVVNAPAIYGDYELTYIQWFADGADLGMDARDLSSVDATAFAMTKYDSASGKFTFQKEALAFSKDLGVSKHKFVFVYTNPDDATDIETYETSTFLVAADANQW